MSSINQNENKEIFSCQFRGLEFCCIVGDILSSNTDCIGAICDSNFSLTFGLTKAIKDAAGDDFSLNLQRERRKQSSSAISLRLSRNCGLRTNFVILCPARRSSRDSFDEIYNHFLSKAKELQIQSMTLPLLGTGHYGLSFDLATQFLKKAFTQFADFGNLKKVQFIDQSENSMGLLRDFFNTQMCSKTNGVKSTFDSTHSKFIWFLRVLFQSDNAGMRFHVEKERSSATSSSNSSNSPNINVSLITGDESNILLRYNGINSNVTINFVMNDDDDDDMDSFWNENISSNHSAVSMNDSNSVSDGFSSESSANEDEAPKSQKVKFNDESVYWSVVPHQQLLSSQKPTTSNNANLDDSTLPCSICLCDMRDILENAGNSVVQLSLCSHMFHMECIRAAFKVKEQCPLCMCWYKDPIGYQPKDAKMTVRQIQGQVQGHKDAKGFHEITYYIPSGIQIDGHIRPGRPYRSMTRIAYLPNNKEGTQILKLLQLAFKRRLIFTIGDSLTTGRKDVPIWNGIHHKTNKEGGPQCYGYPDPGYLSRVKEELAAVGVRSEQLKD
uniref:E3 ubiquitin-protein ligase n=1 Tax=Meloidogyne javanica TaxID=6303 RepID=A0A915LZQ7_MELJA